MRFAKLPLLCLLIFVAGVMLGRLAAKPHNSLSLRQLTQGQKILRRAWANVENDGTRCLVLLTMDKGKPSELPEGDIFLIVLRPDHGRFKQRTRLYLGQGNSADLVVGNLAGEGRTEVFTFIGGQATYTNVFRFHAQAFDRLLTIEDGRPRTECRRGNGRFEIIEHARLDYYDVPATVALESKRLAREASRKSGYRDHWLPMIKQIYRWNGGRFVVDRVMAEAYE